jgi:phosphatidate cytidylyltransferase
MNQRIITGILFTLVIAAFVIPGYWYPVFPIALLLLAGFFSRGELDRALAPRHLGLPPVASRLGVILLLLPLLVRLPGLPAADQPLPRLVWGFSLLVAGQLLWATAMTMTLLIREGPGALPRAAATAFAVQYLAVPFGVGVLLLAAVPQGWLWLVVALVTPWLSDVFAYFVGSMLGRHKIVPQISPKKTVEGCLGGLAGGMLACLLAAVLGAGVAISRLGQTPSLLLAVLAGGVLLSIAAQLGDWLASGVKRWCGVKDFGTCLPGHGGILDRFDSVLFTLPATLLLAALNLLLR